MSIFAELQKISCFLFLRRCSFSSYYICLLVVIASSCSNTDNSKGDTQGVRVLSNENPGSDTLPKPDDTTQVKLISNKLYIFYLENKVGKSQLEKLLGDNSNKQKVVFQFYRDKYGILGLTAWPGKQGNKDFIAADTIRLTRWEESGKSLSGQDVHLSDLQLGRNAAKQLRDSINRSGHNNPNNNYILFVPRIAPDPKTKANYLIYDVIGVPIPQKSALPLATIALLNPSPPRNVDDDY